MQDRGAGAWSAVKWVLVISFMLLVYAHVLLLAPGWLKKGTRALALLMGVQVAAVVYWGVLGRAHAFLERNAERILLAEQESERRGRVQRLLVEVGTASLSSLVLVLLMLGFGLDPGDRALGLVISILGLVWLPQVVFWGRVASARSAAGRGA